MLFWLLIDCVQDPKTVFAEGCRFDEFECDDGQCIPIGYLCDGYNDCSELEDENEANCG